MVFVVVNFTAFFLQIFEEEEDRVGPACLFSFL
jgi:hypothetical protein